MRQMLVTIRLLFILMIPLSFIIVSSGCAQVGANPQNDLRAQNMGDYIMLWWSNQDGATEYIMYRAFNITGPWGEIGRVDADVSLTGGAKIDETPDARLRDLCYKIEAVNLGEVIRFYEPMCVPPYAG